MIAESKTDVKRHLQQPLNKTTTEYSGLLWSKVLFCNLVYDEYVLERSIIERLHELVSQVWGQTINGAILPTPISNNKVLQAVVGWFDTIRKLVSMLTYDVSNIGAGSDESNNFTNGILRSYQFRFSVMTEILQADAVAFSRLIRCRRLLCHACMVLR